MKSINQRAKDYLKSKGIESEKAVKLLVEFYNLESKPKAKKFNFKNSLIELGFDSELVSDWLKVRAKKKATNTKTALNGFIREVDKCELTKDEILTICIERDWKGFKNEWLTNIENERIKNNSQRQSNADIAFRANNAVNSFFGS